MDILTFFSHILEFGTWPIVALIIVCILKDDISALLSTMTKLKAGPVEFERVVRELKETKEIAVATAGKVNSIAEKFDESDEIPEKENQCQQSVLTTAKNLGQAISEVEKKVLKAMVDSRFVTRSVTGVMKDSGLSKADVQATYNSLVAKGLVEKTTNNEGKPRWIVSALGHQIIN